MKKISLIFALLAGAVLAHSQNTTTSGTITLQAASCAGASAGYVYYILPTNTSAVAVTISGTWSATLQFVGSVNGTTWTSVNATPIPTASAVTSTTANGTWTINPAGLAEVCVYASSYASGKAVINASVSTASTAANGSAGGDLSGSYPNPTVVALNGSPLPANSFGALTNSGTGTLSYVPPFAVDITQPPYNAKCDGSTDDYVAIQAALNAGAPAVSFPVSSATNQIQCNVGTGLVWPATTMTLYGNGTILDYTGTAHAIDTSLVTNPQWATINDLQIQLDAVTGSPVAVYSNGGNEILNWVTMYPSGSNLNDLAIQTTGINDILLNMVYPGGLGVDFSGSSITANHLEISCNPGQIGMIIDSFGSSTFNSTYVQYCDTAVKITDSMSISQGQNLTFNGSAFQGTTTVQFNNDAGALVSIDGSLSYSSTDAPLFSTPANFLGNLTVTNIADGSVKLYENGGATGVTANGSVCTTTAIVNGVITGATCTP